jgi:hypothetical protein
VINKKNKIESWEGVKVKLHAFLNPEIEASTQLYA